jgi:hypothetical protein
MRGQKHSDDDTGPLAAGIRNLQVGHACLYSMSFFYDSDRAANLAECILLLKKAQIARDSLRSTS